MLDSIELITMAKEKAKKETGRDSDLAASQALGWSRPRVSSVIRGVSRLSDREVVEVAEYVGVDPVYALVCIRAEYQEDKGSTATPYWRQAAKRLSKEKSAA